MPWPLDLHKSGFKVDVAMLFWRTEAQRSKGTSPNVPSLSGGGGSRTQSQGVDFSTPAHPTAPDGLLLHTEGWRPGHRDRCFLLVLVL